MTAPAAPAPGYYVDPLDAGGERWWDGAGWTDVTRPSEASEASEAPEATHASEPEPVVPPIADVEAGEIPQLAPDPPRPAAAQTVVRQPQIEPEPVAEPEPELEPELQPGPQPVAVAIAPGFYPDPYGQAPLRWWDGQQWTTATSQPESAAQGAAPAPPAPTPTPTSTPAPGARSAAATSRPGIPAGRPGLPTVLPSRGGGFGGGRGLSSTMRRVGLPGLAAVLVLAVALGVRLFVLDTGPAGVAPAQLAAAINLRPGDLPPAWSAVDVVDDSAAGGASSRTVAPGKAGTAASDPTTSPATSPSGSAGASGGPMARFERDVARCIGAADPTTAVAYTSDSPSWSRGGSEISSEVAVMRSETLARQDLRARQGNTVDACMRRVGLPAMRAALAPSGVALTGLSMQRLPGAAADAYALRLKMTATVKGRPLTVWTDSYGFVRGATEVGLTVASVGATPDRAVAAAALRQLRTRASTTP